MCYIIRKDKKRGDAGAPPRFCSRAVQHVQDKADALADGDEANHNRHDCRQQADYLGQYALKHVGIHDLAELSSGSGCCFLRKNPFLNKNDE